MGKIKVEKIIVDDNYTYPASSKKKLPKERLYKEKAVVRKREVSIDETLPVSAKVEKIAIDLDLLSKHYLELKRKILFVKLFSYAKNDKDNTFNKDIALFDNYLKKYNNDLMIVTKYFKAFRINFDEKANTVNEIIEEVYRLFDFESGLNEDIENVKKKYFNEFKVTSHALIKDKTLEEIEDLIIRVDTELNKYKSLEEACDYITYNSGKLLIDVVNGLVKAKIKIKGDLSYQFFLQTSDIINFDLHEWIELFVRINYVREKVKDNLVLSKDLEEKLRNLETRYAIMIIGSEKNEKRVR